MSSLDIVPREESERRLAAILVADVVGHSRLMQADEEGTLARLEEIGANIVDPRVAAHRGRIFRTMGDGLLIEFPSVVEALLCAAEIQEELRLLGEERPPEQRIQLRIGINIGDVIGKGNDVFGTGVNIAARLESLAEPGSIYISGEAYDQVRDRPFAFDDLGMKAVKNIARLVRVYRVRTGEAAHTSKSAAHWRTRNWRVVPIVAGSLTGLAILIAAVVLLVPNITKKMTTADAPPASTAQMPISTDEMSTWAKIKTSERIDELSSFLDRFPNSRYSEYVRHRLNALRSHPNITKFRDCAQCPEMVVIPSGSFTMGASPSDVDRYAIPSNMGQPLHSVRIARQFALGEFLVTRKQYATFVEETGYGGSGCFATTLDRPLLKFDATRGWRDPGFAQADDHPVVCVNWYDAIAYVSWLSKKTGQNYRLPNEAEWEYAGRAGAATGRYFGDAPICDFANVRDRSKKLLYSAGEFFNECDGGFSNTSPVGSFPPNGFGLYDMIGNVWQWVEDCWKFSYRDAPSDGTAREEEPCLVRVMRGASWNSTERYLHTVVTSAGTNPDLRRETDGFRIARDYPAPAPAPPGSPMITQSASPATSSPGAPESPDWDGTWIGSWGGEIAVKIIISGGNVVEYDYSGYPQQCLGETIISGNTLTFRTQRGSVITLTKNSSTTAAAHYDGPLLWPMSRKANAELVRGAPRSSDWDGTWIGSVGFEIWMGSFGHQMPAKIIISGGNVLEYSNGLYGQPRETIISGNTLTLRTERGSVITLTKRGPTTAALHYHGLLGDTDGELVRQ